MEMGIEFSAYLRYVAALVFVLVLIWLAGHVLKRSMGRRLGLKRPEEANLRILEVLPIDSRHKMVLLKHREREHLLLLGNDHAVVVAEQAHQEETPDTPSVTETTLGTMKKEPTL